MKTHELAKALQQLSKLLRSLPNQELDNFGLALTNPVPQQQIGISLSALAALSKYNKLDWEKVIRDFELPLEVRPRDGARDVMGKIITFLAENDAERERVARKTSPSGSDRPSELSNALQFLLNNG
ncbi:hypothetical protein G6L63_11320 [Agrobacterium vitis]|uniref:Uncharacterized protein n=1 Tax=Agrobacterium vitis TaxID=373 RepID=A0A368NGY6_AGRVI|nr:hypothetical protein [Agrobacterium vitis]KAA3512588.1 hypothetical protein DXM22_15095 [Agrobacterium vitis]KAA3525956.1 hypothetical protein DXT89_15515 [Agrobacterium vitis]MUZ99092.1 hypothetical protein [Agrobacterium vitis]MVA31637.1 hypothetical protein [Agrobacterium vitis]NOJ33740.1 hypothetical protein [Agrobacterium vitis]